MQNPWDNDPIVGPAPGGIGRPVIYRAPEQPKPQGKVVQGGQIIDPNTGTAAPISGYQPQAADGKQPQSIPGRPGWFMRSDGTAFQPKGLPPTAGSRADPQATALELRNVIDNAFRAKELSREGWFATGFGAEKAKGYGGTTAADVKAKLDTIGANTAFEQLQKMRAASPTGAALGNVTERELDLLKSTIASLDQAQSDEEFQGSMQRVAESYGRVLSKIPGGRAMMIERGWLPKSGGGGKKPQAASPRIIDLNDLP